MAEERTACVDVPALPLQLLLRRHPEWVDRPVAVVDKDRPQGLTLWVNEKARASRVLPGQRYAAALALCRGLCAGEVAEDEIHEGVSRLARRLADLTPRVEPAAEEPGVFWLDASGLEPLYPSLDVWGRAVRTALTREGFVCRVVVGFSRFGSYAVVRGARGPDCRVFTDAASERRTALAVRLDRLRIEPGFRDTLARLGVHTVKAFLALPEGAVGRRFGPDAERLHRMAAGDFHAPLEPIDTREPVRIREQLEYAETKVGGLLFLVKRLLDPLLTETAERDEAVRELEIHLDLEDAPDRVATIRPAAPTLDAAQILELAHLKLQSIGLPAGVQEITLTVTGVPATRQQLSLFSTRPRRDLEAANRAFARIRTEFGPYSVVRAELREGHLPEARFTWEPLEKARTPRPRPVAVGPLVRRLRERPKPLSHRSRHEPDGWLVLGLERGPVIAFRGPYMVSGGWWAREVHRDYHFLETQRGDVLWVYYDRPRRRWFLHGEVE